MKPTHSFTKMLSWVLFLMIFISACLYPHEKVMAADETQVSVTITSGQLTFAALPDNVAFTNIEITGNGDTFFQTLNSLKVTDARGTGEGWSVEVSATQLQTAEAPVRTLDKGSLKLKKPVTFNSAFFGSPPPSSNHLGDAPYPIDDGNKVKIVKASANSGLGPWTIGWDTDSLSITINPATTKIGTYTSTITWQLNQVPDPA